MSNRRNIRALQAFESLARNGSLVKAAEELGVTQSAVSHQLSRLTAEVGEKLLVRSGRSVVLTEAGRQLAGRLQAAFAQIETSVAEVTGSGRPTVRIAVCSSFAPGWLIGRLDRFRRSNPGVDLQLRMYAADPELTDRVADAFVTTLPTESGFWSLPILKERLVAVAAPGRAGEFGKGLPLITTDVEPHCLGADWAAWTSRAGVALDVQRSGPWLQVTHYVLALELARHGQGAALVPDFLAEELLGSGGLVRLGFASLETGEDYFLSVKTSRLREAGLKALVQWFKAEVQVASAGEVTVVPMKPPAAAGRER